MNSMDWQSKKLKSKGRVYILDEAKDPKFDSYKLNVPKDQIFHILAYSSLVISETTSISIESALLGTPVVRCTSLANTRKGGAAIFEQLNNEELVFSYADEENAIRKIDELISLEKPKEYWKGILTKFIGQFDKDGIEKFYSKLMEFEK